jgi:hypothetical protein
MLAQTGPEGDDRINSGTGRGLSGADGSPWRLQVFDSAHVFLPKPLHGFAALTFGSGDMR